MIRWQILPHVSVDAFAFNGQVSGPRLHFKQGDRVTFLDRNNLPVTGTVSRINQKTVTVVPDNKDGHWRVSATLLNHLIDL